MFLGRAIRTLALTSAHAPSSAHVLGFVHTTNAFLPLLRKGSTKVISISSGVADPELTMKANLVTNPLYCDSKAALNSAVATYAAEFRDEGFTFLAISPGLVNTAEKPRKCRTPSSCASHDGLSVARGLTLAAYS
ncbi:hypothetical protein BV20DRAFT_975337 [Pilatotrama ljubarskyi]|nr:hypothetical protein BV20DRAFT_975337 [Pilatotrama ljubarskyi]